MFMEYIENTIQLLFIMIALLASLFRYISRKKRGWLYAAGFFTSSLLSSYFWTAYLVIMGESPYASDLLTYFGWNISYLILFLLTVHVKSKEERRYFHPLMLLPVPINIWQLLLYLKFVGALNSSYQVIVCTAILCSCLQSLLWYPKHKNRCQTPPYIAAACLFCIVSEFGMWTASCFEGWAVYVYYFFSFLCSASYLLLLRAIHKTYAADSGDTPVVIDQRIQRILKVIYFVIAAVCSLGGIILGIWIRNVLTRGLAGSSESDTYEIISVILFLISIILAAFSVAVILIVYFEQKIHENSLLREAKQVAERSNAAKSDFLANMSHEIRTPLNAVLGMNKMIVLESLRARDHLPEKREAVQKIFADITEYAGNIESAGNNLLAIINDILDFSKIEAGKMDIILHSYRLSSVLNDLSNTVLFKARDKGLSFYMEIDDTIPDHLFGDDMRIRQVINNVLNNAVKYTDSGSITLSLHQEPRSPDEVDVKLVFAVRDTGIGIRKEDISRIFDKFERTDLERNNSIEGTGLGLAITHRLVRMMGGSIRVESEYGEGSVFTIRLPQKLLSTEPIGDFHEKFEQSMDDLHASEQSFRAPEARILIVDDTRMNLTVAEGLLKDTEIQTDTAESGAAALRLCLHERYDLILMDQRMPGMDGTETLHCLREQKKCVNSQIPVICLTADALSGAKERYIAEGFEDYLSKPLGSRALKQMLMKYLPPEKILPAERDSTDSTGQENMPDDADSLYRTLRQAGIDTVTALGYCQQDDGLYRMLLHEFVSSAGEKKTNLQKFYDGQNARDYAILVHSLKSGSRTIGAEKLAVIAEKLEKAADEERWDILADKHGELLEIYDTFVDAVASVVGEAPASVMANVLTEGDDEILEFFPDA